MKPARINLGDTPDTPVVTEKVVRTFDGPGRGRKQCDSCGTYIGVRTKVCVCGHTFTRKKPKTVEVRKKRVSRKGAAPEPVEETPREKTVIPAGYTTNVIAPAGKCPVKLKGTDKETVLDWAAKVRAHGAERGDFYSTYALKYYVRYIYNVFSDEYKAVAAIIDELDQ
jgi:ribosomal protein S14